MCSFGSDSALFRFGIFAWLPDSRVEYSLSGPPPLDILEICYADFCCFRIQLTCFAFCTPSPMPGCPGSQRAGGIGSGRAGAGPTTSTTLHGSLSGQVLQLAPAGPISHPQSDPQPKPHGKGRRGRVNRCRFVPYEAIIGDICTPSHSTPRCQTSG